jgi:hypothetical protein
VLYIEHFVTTVVKINMGFYCYYYFLYEISETIYFAHQFSF